MQVYAHVNCHTLRCFTYDSTDPEPLSPMLSRDCPTRRSIEGVVFQSEEKIEEQSESEADQVSLSPFFPLGLAETVALGENELVPLSRSV